VKERYFSRWAVLEMNRVMPILSLAPAVNHPGGDCQRRDVRSSCRWLDLKRHRSTAVTRPFQNERSLYGGNIGSHEFIRNDLRLKTLPVAAKFLKDKASFLKKPSILHSHEKRVTIAKRSYGQVYVWTVGLTQEDLICVPASHVQLYRPFDVTPWRVSFANKLSAA
jgi:hypothetical protein